MAMGVVKILFCLFLATLAEIDESKVQTSTMSTAEIERFISTMDYTYNLTKDEEDMIVNYYIYNPASMPTYAPTPSTPKRVKFDPAIERTLTSCEDVDKLVEEMDSNYNPTRHERDWIMKCLMPTFPPFDPNEEHTDYWPDWFEVTTVSANEDAEGFQPTDEMVYPVQEEHKPPVQEEHKPPVQEEHKPPVQEEHKPPVQEEHKPPVQEEHKPPVQEEHKPPVQEEHKPPVQEEHKPPVQEEHKPPVQEEHKPPVQEHHDEEYPAYIGSSRGIAGYNYPNYLDIPQTSFTCMEKDIVPGFYADLETGCQVFHVCWPHRRESFLCPVGTIFNQALLTCDFWYNSNCSMAPLYYNVNADAYYQGPDKSESVVGSMIDTLIEKGQHGGSEGTIQTLPPRSEGKATSKVEPDMSYIMRLLPIKAKVTVYPESKTRPSKIVAEASVGRKKKIAKPVAVVEKPAVPKYQYDSSAKFVQDPAVLKVVGEIFDAAKKIVEESRGRASQLKVKQVKLHRPKMLPLTKLNPRFITKPVLKEKIPVESVKESKVLPQTEPKNARVVKRILFKPAFRARTLKKVSPITRKALAGSYLKLLKLKG